MKGDFRGSQIKVPRSQQLTNLLPYPTCPYNTHLFHPKPVWACTNNKCVQCGFAQSQIQMEVICLEHITHTHKKLSTGGNLWHVIGEVRAHPSISTFLPQSGRFTFFCRGEWTAVVGLHKQIWQHILLPNCFSLSCINKFEVCIFPKVITRCSFLTGNSLFNCFICFETERERKCWHTLTF